MPETPALNHDGINAHLAARPEVFAAIGLPNLTTVALEQSVRVVDIGDHKRAKRIDLVLRTPEGNLVVADGHYAAAMDRTHTAKVFVPRCLENAVAAVIVSFTSNEVVEQIIRYLNRTDDGADYYLCRPVVEAWYGPHDPRTAITLELIVGPRQAA